MNYIKNFLSNQIYNFYSYITKNTVNSKTESSFGSIFIEKYIFNIYFWGVKQYFKIYIILSNNPIIDFVNKTNEYIKKKINYLIMPKPPALKIISMRLYNNIDDYHLIEIDEETVKQENLLNDSEKQYLLSLNYLDIFNIKNKNNYIKDSLLLMKEKNKWSVYIKKSKKDIPDLNIHLSKLRFLSIVYINNKTSEFLYLNIDDEFYIIDNELFSPAFIYKLLLNENQYKKFNLDYTIKLLDSRINITEIKNNQYVKLRENHCDVMVLS